MGLMDILAQAASGSTSSDERFDQVAQSVPSDILAKGLADAFRSDETPALGEMIGRLFSNANGQEQAGMLNQILATLGPGIASSLAGGVLGRVMSPGSSQITPDQASQLSPQQVQELAEQAQQTDPGVTDALAGFYAQHSGLIKTMGGAMLAIAMTKMKDRLTQH